MVTAVMNRVCAYCDRKEGDVGFQWHKDHVIPRSKGGSNDPVNLVWSCSTCNIRKKDSLKWVPKEGTVTVSGDLFEMEKAKAMTRAIRVTPVTETKTVYVENQIKIRYYENLCNEVSRDLATAKSTISSLENQLEIAKDDKQWWVDFHKKSVNTLGSMLATWQTLYEREQQNNSHNNCWSWRDMQREFRIGVAIGIIATSAVSGLLFWLA